MNHQERHLLVHVIVAGLIAVLMLALATAFLIRPAGPSGPLLFVMGTTLWLKSLGFRMFPMTYTKLVYLGSIQWITIGWCVGLVGLSFKGVYGLGLDLGDFYEILVAGFFLTAPLVVLEFSLFTRLKHRR